MENEKHPAFLYCQKLWPNLRWQQKDYENRDFVIGADTPLGLAIRLTIREGKGSHAEFRTTKEYISGIIFKESAYRLGVPWKDAIDALLDDLTALGQAITPKEH